MSLLDIFSRSPEKRIARLRKKVKEPHGDASVRIGAAERLFEMGTEPALRALLDRFTISVTPSVDDEREKQQVSDWLVHHGQAAVAPIIQYLKTERAVYWPARTLQRIQGEEEFVQTICEILQFFHVNPPASSESIVQFIRAVEGRQAADLLQTITKYTEDPDDDVVLACVDHLIAGSEEAGREAVLNCYLSAEDRPRLRSNILEKMAEIGWSVKGFRPAVEESLPEGYSLTRDGRVMKLSSPGGP